MPPPPPFQCIPGRRSRPCMPPSPQPGGLKDGVPNAMRVEHAVAPSMLEAPIEQGWCCMDALGCTHPPRTLLSSPVMPSVELGGV